MLVYARCGVIKKEFFMYINITGSPNNKDVYIYQSYRDNGIVYGCRWNPSGFRYLSWKSK